MATQRPGIAISSRVAEVVARSKRVDVTTLPPLYEAVDPDALDALFSPRSTGPPENGNALSVQFTYADRTVFVHSNGEIDVR